MMYKRVLIATDGSDLAQKAVNQGLSLAKALGASAIAVHVTLPWTSVAMGEIAVALPPDTYDRMADEDAQIILGRAALAADAADVECEHHHVKDSLPAEGIITAALRHNADLIVMSSHGRHGFARILLGSAANEVVRRSAVPVLICR